MSSQSRKQRRAYEKFLKKTNPQAYKEWKSDSINRGNQIHQEHLDNIAIDSTKIDLDSNTATIDVTGDFDDPEIIDYENLQKKTAKNSEL